jgi:hypothetical protein
MAALASHMHYTQEEERSKRINTATVLEEQNFLRKPHGLLLMPHWPHLVTWQTPALRKARKHSFKKLRSWEWWHVPIILVLGL